MNISQLCPIGLFFYGWGAHDAAGWSHTRYSIHCALTMAAVSNRSVILPDTMFYGG